jgi:hypothetical protein
VYWPPTMGDGPKPRRRVEVDAFKNRLAATCNRVKECHTRVCRNVLNLIANNDFINYVCVSSISLTNSLSKLNSNIHDRSILLDY